MQIPRPGLVSCVVGCLLAVAAAGVATSGALGAGTRHVGGSSCSCSSCCNSVFRAGEGSADLKVRVVGSAFDTIEAYFKDELYFRDTFPHSCNLHCGNHVAVAPKNDFGTFAVRFGKCGDSVRIYGWKKDAEKPEMQELTLEPGYPVRICWETSRILKVHYGPRQAKEYVIRFSDADQAWLPLYQTP